jgi:hypothetical protein
VAGIGGMIRNSGETQTMTARQNPGVV